MRFSIFLGIFFTAKKSIFNAKNENSENSESSENSENSQKILTAMGSYSNNNEEEAVGGLSEEDSLNEEDDREQRRQTDELKAVDAVLAKEQKLARV